MSSWLFTIPITDYSQSNSFNTFQGTTIVNYTFLAGQSANNYNYARQLVKLPIESVG